MIAPRGCEGLCQGTVTCPGGRLGVAGEWWSTGERRVNMSNVVGTWTITTDFGCDGSIAGTFSQTFIAEGTWTNAIGSNGRWYQVEGLVVWDFNNAAKLVYSANLAG